MLQVPPRARALGQARHLRVRGGADQGREQRVAAGPARPHPTRQRGHARQGDRRQDGPAASEPRPPTTRAQCRDPRALGARARAAIRGAEEAAAPACVLAGGRRQPARPPPRPAAGLARRGGRAAAHRAPHRPVGGPLRHGPPLRRALVRGARARAARAVAARAALGHARRRLRRARPAHVLRGQVPRQEARGGRRPREGVPRGRQRRQAADARGGGGGGGGRRQQEAREGQGRVRHRAARGAPTPGALEAPCHAHAAAPCRAAGTPRRARRRRSSPTRGSRSTPRR